MRRRWKLRPYSTDAAATLSQQLKLKPRLARLLAGRGLTDPVAVDAFLRAQLSEHLRSPMLFRQMGTAAERVLAALSRGERIGIFGDYDVDGISGSAILVRFLRALGQDPALFIPHRMRDGYGLGEPGIRALAEQGVGLMITVDCGGCAHAEIELARTLGIDTIVCDHHQVSGTPLPAHAVLNPIEPDAGFPFRGLSGAGVAFYLALGIRKVLRDRGTDDVPDLRRCLDLVTLGTVADVVPLVEENRVLVRHGLLELMRTGAPGIVALKEVSGVTSVTSGVVGFRLAPRLNAAGRLSDARRGVELLSTADADRARVLAGELDQENRTRQAIEKEMVADALDRLARDTDAAQRKSIVLASEDWHPGVIGIVAARLVDRFHKPAVMIAIDPTTGIGRGSGRSIPKINLHAAFSQCASDLLGFGGHPMAAGLTISRDRVAEFRSGFDNAVISLAAPGAFDPEILVDDELAPSELQLEILAELEQLEPFGAGNPQPLFLVRNLSVAHARRVGENHLKLLLRRDGVTFGAIGFGMADESIEVGACVDLVCSLHRNEWQGNVSVDAHIRDWRPSQNR